MRGGRLNGVATLNSIRNGTKEGGGQAASSSFMSADSRQERRPNVRLQFKESEERRGIIDVENVNDVDDEEEGLET